MHCVAVGVGSDADQSGSNVIISNRIVDTKCAYKLGAGSVYTSSRDVFAGATRSRSSIRDDVRLDVSAGSKVDVSAGSKVDVSAGSKVDVSAGSKVDVFSQMRGCRH